MTRLSILVFLGYVFTLGNVGAASASPQILAAVPVGGPLELMCHDGVCETEFSAICLQPGRRAPQRGTPYRIHTADIGSIVLAGYTATGESVALPSSLLHVASLRGQTAIRFFVEQKVLNRRGVRSVSIELNRMIALIPEPQDDGASPQTTAEIVEAVSGVEKIAHIWAKYNSNNMSVTRIAVRVSNSLPMTGGVSNTQSDRMLKLAAAQDPNISPEALETSRRMVALCQRRSHFTPMRNCLGEIHDQIMRNLNISYWAALEAGS